MRKPLTLARAIRAVRAVMVRDGERAASRLRRNASSKPATDHRTVQRALRVAAKMLA